MTESVFDPDVTDHGSNGRALAKPADDELNRFLEDTLGSVLRSARESAAEMMDRAKRAAADEVSRTQQLNAAARAEVDRMTAWRARVDPLVHAANDTAEAIQRAVADVPSRVAGALAPVNEALAEMDDVMARLTEALRPPDGSGGPAGPTGGTRSFDASGDVPPTEQPPRERVGVVPPHSEAEAPAEAPRAVSDAPVETVSEDSAPIDAATDPGVDDDASTDVDVPAAATADIPKEVPALPRSVDAVVEEERRERDLATPTASAPKWVDWSWNEKGPAPIAGAAGTPTNGADPDPDDDEVALKSATTQLRRAVTDIDWRDLPSASNG